ncbi:hypothetical protein V6N13_127368 [Hibiscus sabdariffa]|uniref:F-box domain-containing protein n=1 Tax=Hibiscus sabdariffa TaxID=183260 RepID=A0ABR2RCP9_9ROSI
MEHGKNWSELPELLLWIIRAKLSFIDSVRFGAVCKNWQYASESFPQHLKSERNDVSPWLMVNNIKNPNSSKRLFISVSPNGKLTHCKMKRKAFKSTLLLGSAKGWLLLAKVKDGATDPDNGIEFDTSNPIILFNPFTVKTIKMPFFDVDDSSPPLWGGILIRNNAPHQVVLSKASHISLEVWIAHPGDDTWNHFSYDTYVLRVAFDANFHYRGLVANRFCCVDVNHRLITFDLENHKWENSVWKKFDEEALCSIFGVMDGDDTTKWIKFDRKDIESISDCLECQNSFVICSSSRRRGTKVYNCDYQSFGESKCSINVENLVDGSHQSIPVRALRKYEVGNWVDLG